MDSSTSKERGLLKQCCNKKHTIISLSNDLEQMKLLSSKTIGNLGGIESVIKYRIELGGWEKTWLMTTIKPYTNKKGYTSNGHFTVNGRYMGRAVDGDKPKPYLGWLEVNEDNIHKWEITDLVNFTLSPVVIR